MNFPFQLELVKPGKKTCLYTVRMNDDNQTEFDKFLANEEVRANQEFGAILVRIDEIADKYGAQERFFKLKESSALDTVAAIWRGDIRLYCCKYSKVILILGSGGIKKTRTYQEDDALNNSVKLMAEVSQAIDKKILVEKSLNICDNKFCGNTNFF